MPPKHYTYDKKRCDWVVQFWNPVTKKLIRVTRVKTERLAQLKVKEWLATQQKLKNLESELNSDEDI